MDYTDLVDRLLKGLETDEDSFVSQVDNFIRNAEESILQKVEVYALRKVQVTNLIPGEPEITLPDDFIAPYSFVVGKNLILKDESFIREAYPTGTETGTPIVYALQGPTVAILGPAPITSSVATIRYYYRPESIVTAGTTWLSTNAERALELATKIEGYRFQKGDEDLMQELRTSFQDALNDLVAVGYARPRRDTFRAREAMT